MRLIDADALKMSLLLIAPGEAVRYCYPCKEILKAIKNAPTITTEPHWIPVSERLPDKEGRYLARAVISFVPDHVDDPCTYQGTTIAYFFMLRGKPFWDGKNVEKVLAWMPLPESYEGEQIWTRQNMKRA